MIHPTGSERGERVILISACNNPETYQKFAAQSRGIDARDFRRYDNLIENRPVPVRYNEFISDLPPECDAWLVFAHNDFVFHDDPRPWLTRVSKVNLYGVIGAELAQGTGRQGIPSSTDVNPAEVKYVVRGQVACSPRLIPDGLCGNPVDGMIPVKTVDCCCIIVHSSLIRRHDLRFDESYEWHFYSEELSLRAFRRWSVRTFVLPIWSGHYGMGTTNEAFHEGAHRLLRDYPETFASTRFNPLAGSRREGNGGMHPEQQSWVPIANTAASIMLSVVVVVARMSRQAMRTLHSLSAQYQRGITAQQYEVLIYENASDDTLPQRFVNSLPENFRYTLVDPPSPSPVFALNRGLREARGRVIGAMFDGARIVTPGLLRRALFASRIHSRSVVTSMDWCLGCDVRRQPPHDGYGSGYEDALLARIAWPKNPYRLFEVSTQDQSAVDGWVTSIAESKAIFMPREMWSLVGGFDERFVSPGGGLANHDLLKRACETPQAQHVLICDEATFLQTHGGFATNAEPNMLHSVQSAWAEEYERIRGVPFEVLDQRNRVLFGAIRPEIAPQLVSAILEPIRGRVRPDGHAEKFIGSVQDIPVRGLSGSLPHQRPAAGGVAQVVPVALVRLVKGLFTQGQYMEVRDVCRLVAVAVGHGNIGPLERYLSLCANTPENLENVSTQRRFMYLSAIAQARQLLGESSNAEDIFSEALHLNPLNDDARARLSALRLPGETYYRRLADLQEFFAPGNYLEIGVFEGDSICLARPPTQVFGVDPSPTLKKPCTADTRIFPCTSDEFFARNQSGNLLPGRVDLGFIDGLHDFMQVVRDFWNLERLCELNSVVAFHDTLPLDEYSATKERKTIFWTGDVWKIIPFLMSERSDLRVVTIKAPPSGLTLVSGLCPSNAITLEQTMARAAVYDSLSYSDFIQTWRPRMCVMENSRPALAHWLLFGAVRH